VNLALNPALPNRWTALRPHDEQRRLWRSKARFRVVPAGRRSGKTELAKRYLVRRAVVAHEERPQYDSWFFFAAAPTRDQAKRIYWDDLKRLVPDDLILSISESQLIIKLITGAEIHVIGMDKPERIEGTPWDGGILDEYGNMKARTWTLHVRPALSDRGGWCWLIGVPEGRNHYYDIFKNAQADDTGEWDAFHWKSADILPAAEVEAARRDLDELSFQQEYEGSFIHFQGRAYYTFDEKIHCRALTYDPVQPLIICFDFNVSPGVAVVCQEQVLPGVFLADGEPVIGTGVIGEVHIPRNSNTPAVCRKLVQDWGGHLGKVFAYGDATGGAKGTAKLQGSDWDIIAQELRPTFGQRLFFRVPKSNPAERVRVNSMNTRFQSATGLVRMMVDARRAPHVVRDLEGVRVLEGGSGEIDKQSDPHLTHLSDAVGYYIVREYPIIKLIGEQQELRIV
jgi:hypothetical protein